MPRARDRVKDTSTTTGTGDFTLANSAPSGGYQTFYAAYGLNTPFPYCIVNSGSNEWETGLATLSSSTVMVRGEVANGSSGEGTLVNFSAGTKDVFSSAIAHWLMDFNPGAMLARTTFMAMP